MILVTSLLSSDHKRNGFLTYLFAWFIEHIMTRQHTFLLYTPPNIDANLYAQKIICNIHLEYTFGCLALSARSMPKVIAFTNLSLTIHVNYMRVLTFLQLHLSFSFNSFFFILNIIVKIMILSIFCHTIHSFKIMIKIRIEIRIITPIFYQWQFSTV